MTYSMPRTFKCSQRRTTLRHSNFALAYLTYTAVEIEYYASLHEKIFGREIPQVMLLHANRLNADVIGRDSCYF